MFAIIHAFFRNFFLDVNFVVSSDEFQEFVQTFLDPCPAFLRRDLDAQSSVAWLIGGSVHGAQVPSSFESIVSGFSDDFSRYSSNVSAD